MEGYGALCREDYKPTKYLHIYQGDKHHSPSESGYLKATPFHYSYIYLWFVIGFGFHFSIVAGCNKLLLKFLKP